VRLGSQVGIHSLWIYVEGCGRLWTRLGDLRIKRLGVRVLQCQELANVLRHLSIPVASSTSGTGSVHGPTHSPVSVSMTPHAWPSRPSPTAVSTTGPSPSPNPQPPSRPAPACPSSTPAGGSSSSPSTELLNGRVGVPARSRKEDPASRATNPPCRTHTQVKGPTGGPELDRRRNGL